MSPRTSRGPGLRVPLTRAEFVRARLPQHTAISHSQRLMPSGSAQMRNSLRLTGKKPSSEESPAS